MIHRHPLHVLVLVALTSTASAVDFASQISPIFRNKCYACHSVTKKVKGKLALDNDKISEQIGRATTSSPESR